ncbi:hypothetical protein PKB_5035 [Pseudomonas knackmussii B13]|uniref:Uncharacterized protein n=1 Tax=Pseudomonas knackmussii (strain DSM 6978 / CCUG 54928 / LMG 23759 / B13) TaxID=1301098 RepID=A0A024HPJ5_PSEKB|nr:hypothetical protein [Pseudomonas knackmussii]CDF86348.1 hypothetical protein PKB_5035 [Pseudomonas knackmussii B13]
MAVTIVKLIGEDIPERFSRPGVEAVWKVMVNGGIVDFCLSEEDAYGLAAQLEHAEESRKPKLSKGPRM